MATVYMFELAPNEFARCRDWCETVFRSLDPDSLRAYYSTFFHTVYICNDKDAMLFRLRWPNCEESKFDR